MTTVPAVHEGRAGLLRAYCLGILAEGDREEIERQLFTHEDVHEELQATADDLIHAYLAEQLSSEERSLFEGHFLASPRRRERVAFVRDLMTAVDRVGPHTYWASRPTLPNPSDDLVPLVVVEGAERDERKRAETATSWTLTLVTSVAAALAMVTVLGLLRAHAPAPPSVAAPPSPTPATSSVMLDDTLRNVLRPSGDGASRSDVPVNLPAAPSAGGPVDVLLPKGALALHLRIAVGEPVSPSYAVVLGRPGEPPAWRAAGVAPDASRALIVTIPRAGLEAGEYEVVVEGEPLPGAAGPSAVRHRLRLVRQP